MALTTTTRSAPSRRYRAMRPATWRMRSASASEEPPYFWTMSRDMMGVYASGSEALWGRWSPSAMTSAPSDRTACTAARPAIRSACARRSMAAAMVAGRGGSSLKAMTVGTGTRQAGAPGAGRPGGRDELGQLRIGARTVGLMETIDGARREEVEAALAQGGHGKGGGADVVDGVGEGHRCRQRGSHGGRREVLVGDVAAPPASPVGGSMRTARGRPSTAVTTQRPP